MARVIGYSCCAVAQVPGLNAPIPPGTQFGYQAGGWGKPPVNEEGEPLYGDVFGQFADEEDDEQVTVISFAHTGPFWSVMSS